MGSRLSSTGVDDRVVMCTDLYAKVKFAQERRGRSLADNDLWIAATALATDATLASRDSDFQGIERLAIVEP